MSDFTDSAASLLASVKAAIDPTPPSSADARLTSLITTAATWFESAAGYHILADTYTELRDGTGSPILVLREHPVSSVSSVEVSGVQIPLATGTTGTGFVFDESAVRLRGYIFRRGIQNVQVVYTAGFDDLPEDIFEFLVQSVTLAYKRAPHLDYQSKQLAGEVVTYWKDALPSQAMDILEGYKRRVAV